MRFTLPPATFSITKVRSELTNRIEKLDQGRSNTEAWLKAVRHDLASERAKRENTEERLATVTNDARVRRKIRIQPPIGALGSSERCIS